MSCISTCSLTRSSALLFPRVLAGADFQVIGVDWMLRQEQKAVNQGGIIADDMGMGKVSEQTSLHGDT